MYQQDDLLLKARAIELIRKESEKASKRRKAIIFAAGVVTGVLLTVWFSVHRSALASLLL